MRKPILFLATILSSFIFSQAQAVRTSVADGLGTNPFIWDCLCIPLPNDSIIINHNVTLNVDFGFTDGAVVINPSGRLIGDSPMRAFAFAGAANFVNNGIFNVARVAFLGGSATSGGTFSADSFFTNITTTQGWVSNGDMNISTSYWNTGKFVLGSGAELIVGDNFYNGDSLISGVNAILINDGGIRVNLDFANSDTMRGTGQVCIYGSSLNLGVITGTLDMCDNTGGGPVDLNLGTISGTVTNCVSTCNIGINEISEIQTHIYPNPTSDFIQIYTEENVQVMVYDMIGHLVYSSSVANNNHTISLRDCASGVYIYQVYTGNGRSTGKFIKQ
jgi:Secretion system C-terminal sorting domain